MANKAILSTAGRSARSAGPIGLLGVSSSYVAGKINTSVVLPPSPMANLIRCAKSGTDWSVNELLAYNITIQHQSGLDFFGHEPGSADLDHFDPNLFSFADPSDLSKETYHFFSYLKLASRPHSGQESAINDLAKSVLEVTGFDNAGTVLHMRYNIPLTICGDDRQVTRPDVCLVHVNSTVILLVVQQGKTGFSSSDPEPQVIAEAIATFQYNNKKRARLGLLPLDAMTIPCITMVGTWPSFYKVPVTQHLSDSVAAGQFPMQQTVVTCCTPIRHRIADGMEMPDNRRTALRYYGAFRDLARDSLAALLIGYD